MLRAILRNLITNAVKFTHRDGKVEVDAIAYPGYVEVTISDNGIGMPKVTMAKLSELMLISRHVVLKMKKELALASFYARNLSRNMEGKYGL